MLAFSAPANTGLLNSAANSNLLVPHMKLGPAAVISWVRSYAQQLPSERLEGCLEDIEKWLIANDHYKEFSRFLETVIECRISVGQTNPAYNNYKPSRDNISLASARLELIKKRTSVAKLAYAALHGWNLQDAIGSSIFKSTERYLSPGRYPEDYAHLFCAGYKMKGALPDRSGAKALNCALKAKDSLLAAEVLVAALSETRFSLAIASEQVLETIGNLLRRGNGDLLKRIWEAPRTSKFLKNASFQHSLKWEFSENAAELVSREDDVLFGRILGFAQDYPDLHAVLQPHVQKMACTIAASQSQQDDHQFRLCNLEIHAASVPCWQQAFHDGIQAGHERWKESSQKPSKLEKALQRARREQRAWYPKKTP